MIAAEYPKVIRSLRNEKKEKRRSIETLMLCSDLLPLCKST